MPTVSEIAKYLDSLAPASTKMDFDNVGFLAGRAGASVSRVLLALDITDDVVSEAVEAGAQLVVSHHPLFFSLKTVTDGDYAGRKIVKLLENGVSAICMHTNLDAARGGVNDALAAKLGIENAALLHADGIGPDGEPYGIPRFGSLPSPLSMAQFLPIVKAALSSNGLRYHDAGRPVCRVAVCGGSGSGDIPHVLEQGCDTYVTADIKYDQFLRAAESGLNLIDADHFCTENTVIPALYAMLKNRWPELDISISKRHAQTAQFF